SVIAVSSCGLAASAAASRPRGSTGALAATIAAAIKSAVALPAQVLVLFLMCCGVWVRAGDGLLFAARPKLAGAAVLLRQKVNCPRRQRRHALSVRHEAGEIETERGRSSAAPHPCKSGVRFQTYKEIASYLYGSAASLSPSPKKLKA